MSYAVFFDKNHETIRLPVNPESFKISSGQSIENYNILKLGQIAKPTGMELRKYSFEAELPSKQYGYVTTLGDFKPAAFYLDKFRSWRLTNEPVRLVVNNDEGFDISILVLIESLEVEEKAGEEGDYYISYELVEYQPFSKKEVSIQNKANTQQNIVEIPAPVPVREAEPPKPNNYTIVAGDSLWSIAKTYLGDGARYQEIASLNSEFGNVAIVYPGQVIRLA